MQVNAETLRAQIQNLEKTLAMFGFLSLDQEFKLDAYRKLLAYMQASPERPLTSLYTTDYSPETCRHLEVRWSGLSKYCCSCGKELYNYD